MAITTSDNRVVHIDKTGSVMFTEVRANTPALTPARAHTIPKDDRSTTLSFNANAEDLASWGSNNLFPQEVLEKVGKIDLLSSYLNWIVKAMSSGTLEYGIEEFDKSAKKKIFIPQFLPEVEDWLECSRIREDYLAGITTDMKYLGNTFTEFVMNRGRSKVSSIKRIDASFCRLQRQDEKTGQINRGWVSANWKYHSGVLNTDTVTPVQIFMPQVNQTQILREKNGLFKFLYPVAYPKIGKLYYSLAPWHPIMSSGWLELLIQIPKIKNKYFENSLKLKYHIEVDERYWPRSIPNWDQLDLPIRIQEKKKKMAELEAIFTDTEGAGKTVKTEMIFEPHTQTQLSLIKVHELKSPVEDGLLQQDTQEAAGHLCAALNIDPTLVTTPDKNLSGGSGSDKMRAWEVFTMISVLEQRLTMQPIEFAMNYNLNKRLKFRITSPTMSTLNEVTPSNRALNE